MAKYKIKHTSIMHNKKLCKEGSIIELNDEQAVRLQDFIELVPNQNPAKSTNKTTSSKTKKAPIKAETTVNKLGETTDGGSNVQ